MKKIGLGAALLVLIVIIGWRAQPTWITVWRGELSPQRVYIVGTTAVAPDAIGRLYNVLTPSNHAGPDLSNRLPAGTKIYQVRGTSPGQDLAVEIHRDDFVLGRYAGTHKPS